MLDNQIENVKKLKETLSETNVLNPEETNTLRQLIKEYETATKVYKTYNELVGTIVNGKTRVSLLNGWAAQLINRKKEVKGETADLFVKMINEYTSSGTRVGINNAILEATKVVDTQETEKQEPKVDVNPVEVAPEDIETTTAEEESAPTSGPMQNVIAMLKAQINQIVKGNDYTNIEYSGNLNVDLNKVKPTEAEVTEYTELLNKIDEQSKKSGKKTSFFTLINKPYNKKNKTGLTKEEDAKIKELNAKLNNWRTLSGFNMNDSSIAEILEVISQLQNATNITDTNYNVSPEQFFKPAPSSKSKGGKGQTRLNTIISPDIAVAKKMDTGTYEISHVAPRSLLSLFPESTLHAVINGKVTDVNTIPEAKLAELEKTEGTEFILTQGDSKVSIKINERQRLVINSEELEAIIPGSRIRILDFGNSAFMPIFVQDSEGNFEPLAGDFTIKSIDDNENIVLESDKLYELESGTILRTVVNLNDSYNAELIEKYRAGTITEEEFINNINIYIATQGAVDNILGVLRAIKPDTNSKSKSFSKIYMIRKQAASRALASNSPRVEVGISLTFSHTRIGSPNLTVTEVGGELIPNNIKLTEEALKLVDDYGYMLNGELFTNKNLDYEGKETTFARATSTKEVNRNKKVPVIVFKYKSRRIVFPVTLTTSPETKSKKVGDIVNDRGLSDMQKLHNINEILIESNINPNDYAIADLESKESLDELQRLMKDLESIPDYSKVEDWVKKDFDKEELLTAMEVAVDITNKPFSTGKGILDLEGTHLPTEFDMENESVNVIDNYANKVDLIFRDKEPFVDMKTETKFYQAYSSRTIHLAADTHILKRANVSAMQLAFKEKIPKAVMEVLGKDLVDDIKREIKQFELITEGIKASRAALKGKLGDEIETTKKECK
jgi:hypothetical protein